MNIFSVLRGSCHTKNIWLLSKPRQRSDSGNLPMDFLAFIEQTRKEKNTYFIDLLIIENVELERVLWRECFIEKKFTMFSHRKVQTVSVFIVNGFVYCSIFVYWIISYHLLYLGVRYSVILLNNCGLIMQEKSLFRWFSYVKFIILCRRRKF